MVEKMSWFNIIKYKRKGRLMTPNTAPRCPICRGPMNKPYEAQGYPKGICGKCAKLKGLI